jgi:DNA polymerase III alpha subunit
MDSVTKYKMYIAKAQECGMKALAFSEHGNCFEWYHKKCDIEKAGMKYIHACEFYITKTIEEKVRDNYHCVLIAKNHEGFKELNELTSKSFNRTDDTDGLLFRSADSPITPEMDAEYLAAVEAGDMETAQRMVIEAAKLAMPNTKVVDENGNPKIVYHGSPYGEIKVFNHKEVSQQVV